MSEKEKIILVLGDVMLDTYIVGEHLGDSPEAEVPLLRQTSTADRLGGAGNVAINLRGLNLNPVLLSVCGDDAAGYLIRDICIYSGIESYIITDQSRKTTHKKRVVDAGFNQFLRIDSEDHDDLNSDIESKLKEKFLDLLKDKKIAAIIIQDYNKGCITKSIIKFAQAECRTANIPLVVDPKSNNFRLLSNCTAFKPNLKELSNALGRDILPEVSSIQSALDELQLDSNAQFFVTLANKGIFYKKNEEAGIIHGHEVENPDVSGAGDTVLAVIAYGLVSGLDIHAISKIANQAGAAVVSKSGVSPVNLEDIF